MKTGKLFAGVALATLSAACTNEVMQLEPQAPEAGNRPMVNVELSFEEDAVQMGNGETRLEFDKVAGQGYQWLFAEGDRIGGLLMDTWNGGSCGIDNFELVNYVHTNYAFIRQTGEDGKAKWVTPENAPVCEGNYFFYFPYNDNFAHRGYVGWDVNPVQKQYNEAGELFQMQAVKDNQKWIGYKFVSDKLEGKVNKIDFDFVPVFAMPAFHFENMTGQELTVNKLVIRSTSNGSYDNQGDYYDDDFNRVNPSGTHELMATTMALTPAARGFSEVNKGWEKLSFGQKTAEMWKKAQSYTYNSDEEEQYKWPVQAGGDELSWDIKGLELFPLNENHTAASIRQAPTYEYVADFTGVEGGYKVQAGEHIQALLTMPGGLYAYGNTQTFEAYVYVTSKVGDNYVARIDLGRAQTQGATNTSWYDDIVSGAANKFLKPGMTTKYKANIDATALQSYAITDAKPTSTDDLLWILNEAEGDGIYDLDVTTSGSRVELNDSVVTLLKKKPYIRLRVNGEITITAEDSTAINLLYFTNYHMNTKLNIVNKQVRKPQNIVDPTTGLAEEAKWLGTPGSTINVKKGAELKAEEITIVAREFNNQGTAVTSNIFAYDVINSGKLTAGNIKGDVTNSGELKAGDIEGYVENSGKLTAGDITGDVKNSGELKAGDIKGNVSNSGTLEAKDVEYNVSNLGKLTVNNVKGSVVNGDVDHKAAEASVASVTGTVTNHYGTITLRGSEYKAEVTNEATMNIEKATLYADLVNSGTLNLNKDVTVGTADAEADATNTGTINIAGGKVFNVIGRNTNTGGTINVGVSAKMISKKNIQNIEGATINNNGTVYNVYNNGSLIVCGKESYTTIMGGKGTVDNSKLGDVSYEQAPEQTVILKVADITGISVAELNDMIQKADANQLIITEGILDLGDEWSEIKGHDVDNHLSHFAKGIILEKNVTIIGEPGCDMTFYTNEITIKEAGTLFADTYAKVAFCGKNGSSSVSTTMHVNGLLRTADHATVKGSSYLKLLIDGNGMVRNAGVIEGTLQSTWKGSWTGNEID